MEKSQRLLNFRIEHALDVQKIQADNKCSLKVYIEVFLQQFWDTIPVLFVKLALAVQTEDWPSFLILIKQVKSLSGFCGASHVYYDCIFILMDKEKPATMLKRYQRLVEDVISLDKLMKDYAEITPQSIELPEGYTLRSHNGTTLCLSKNQRIFSRINQRSADTIKP